MIITAVAAHAYCVIFTPYGSHNEPSNFIFSSDEASLYFDDAIDDGNYYKVFEGTEFKIHSSYANITRVVVECAGQDTDDLGPGNFTADRGTYFHDGKFGVWDGASQWVAFTAQKDVWITRVLVYFGDLSPLSITPSSSTQYASYKVNISSSYYDADIYYTLDGSTPTVNSTKFIKTFTLRNKATVKAIVVRNGIVLHSATANYEYVSDATKVSSIQEALSAPDSTAVRFSSNVYVVEHKNPYLWVKDDSGYALFYGKCDVTYERGNLIFSGFGGTKVTKDGVPMFVKPSGFRRSLQSNNRKIEPDSITLREVDIELFAHYVYLENLTISTEDNGQSYTLTDENGTTCVANFSTMGTAVPNNLEVPYNVWAVVGADSNVNSGCELLPLMLEEAPIATDGEDPIVISPSQVGPSTCGHQVILRQVSGYYGTIRNLDGETCEAYITYDPVFPMVLCWSYDITGVVESYQHYGPSGYDLTDYCLKVTDILSLNCDLNDTADIRRIHTLFNMDQEAFWGEYFDLTGHFITPLTAVYQNGEYLYVRDTSGDYGLVYGGISGTFTNGDIIHDAKAKPFYYSDVDMIDPVVSDSFVPDGHHDAISPKVLNVADLNKKMIHHYVCIKDATLSFGDGQTPQSVADVTGSLALYNQFGIEITEDSDGANPYDLNGDGEVNISDINKLIDRILSNATAAETENGFDYYDVIGFLTKRSGNLALIPIEIVHHGDARSPLGDINDDGEENIADINSIIDYIINP